MAETAVGIALDNHSRGKRCGYEVARAALAQLGQDKTPSFALLFTSHPQPGRVLKGVGDVLGDVPLIGATSAGEYSHAGYVEDGAGLMLVHNDGIHFHPLGHPKRWFRFGSLLGQLHGTTEAGLGSAHHRTLVLFPDDRSMSLDKVVDQAMAETAMLYDILGGPGPTIPTPPRPPAVFFNRRMFKAGLVGAEILSQQPIGAALANGWTPVSGPYRVTKVDERRVIRIDGRPAREVYEDFLHEQGITSGDDIPHRTLLQHPIGICQNGDCKVSVLMGIDTAGALQVTSPPPENSLIHILGTQPDAMITAASRAIRQALGALENRQTAGVLFIDCMSTAMVLEGVYAQQRQAVQQTLGDLPFLGFRSHGVLARLRGQIAGHFECSVAACMLPQ
jgi:hypothetical protein